MEDITFRAIKTLTNVDVIACEDTRMTGKLLSRFGIETKRMVYNDHSTAWERNKIIELVEAGKSVALVSDAGTPLISDPGYKLVREMMDKGLKIVSIPGASSVPTALSICGLPTDRFLFAGFLPPKKESRRNFLLEFKETKATLVFFETAVRLLRALEDIDALFPTREMAVARELTKKFEEVRRGTASELSTHYTAHPPKGEIVLLIAQDTEKNTTTTVDLAPQIREALKHLSLKDAVAMVADASGVNKKEVYKVALEVAKDK
jgi:16S rRNA (cytidine1402-2'-O)-methyltransferase